MIKIIDKGNITTLNYCKENGFNILVFKNFFEEEDIKLFWDKFKSADKFTFFNEYLGAKKFNIGYRYIAEDMGTSEDSGYNKWFKKELAPIDQKVNNLIEGFYGSSIKSIHTKPVFHGINKPLEFYYGLHKDISSLENIFEKYVDSYTNWTALSYMKLPEFGGRLILLDSMGNEIYLNANVKDLVLFNSNVPHTIEEFENDDENDFLKRVSMVTQFSILEDGSVKQWT